MAMEDNQQFKGCRSMARLQATRTTIASFHLKLSLEAVTQAGTYLLMTFGACACWAAILRCESERSSFFEAFRIPRRLSALLCVQSICNSGARFLVGGMEAKCEKIVNTSLANAGQTSDED